MKVNKDKFIALIEKECGSVSRFCNEYGINEVYLMDTIKDGEPFTYEEAKHLLTMFGAEAMAKVIDWEAMNVRCPI